MIKLPFNIKLGLSRRKKAPVFYMFEKNFTLYQLLSVIVRIKWVKVISKDEKSVTVELYGQQLKLLNEYFLMLATEWQTWEKHYLPTFCLTGKFVLDVGAGCGETVFFYLLHGARKVVAIEPNTEAAKCLKENAERNHWNMKLKQEPFKLEHLSIPHDFMKMDIEGGEIELLKVPYNKPCAIEVHSNATRRGLEEKGFVTTYERNGYFLVSFTPD